MSRRASKLYDLVNVSDPQAVIAEIVYILGLMLPDYNPAAIESLYNDIVDLFKGRYPGYRASNTKYHDLEHTNAVAVAVARLMHGCSAGNTAHIGREELFPGIAAALFHDVGLIQTANDREGSGAKYTIGHENRSIAFMKQYLRAGGYAAETITDCAHLIMCTNLNLPISDICFRTPRMALLGKIVGSADLLAQIADRYYLEKLLLLFEEFEEAGVPGFNTEIDLLKKTESFYRDVARKRLNVDFSGVAACMKFHFQAWWGLKKDLYAQSIDNNIRYLKSILRRSNDNLSAFRENLRRGK